MRNQEYPTLSIKSGAKNPTAEPKLLAEADTAVAIVRSCGGNQIAESLGGATITRNVSFRCTLPIPIGPAHATNNWPIEVTANFENENLRWKWRTYTPRWFRGDEGE